ncbi:HTH domain-containing protein [Salinigranum halophilum]|uniref:HTH domain-containing protein n=1 Tax=Salinigranum halophilum TaxID=2565931 RepID=UPI0010A8B001|nr:HTH domain-containing protein [Salinigranum halophilum]
MSASTNSPERYSRPGQTTGRRLELWIRPGAREDEASRLVRRARALESEGCVEAVEVREWDAHQDLSSRLHSHREQEAQVALQAFKRWAWQHGSELSGFGERRRAGRGRMGPEYVTQRVPRVLLAEYQHGVLVNVTPCDRRARCISERLAGLEAEREQSSRSQLLG